MQLDLVTTVRAILFQFVPSPLGVLYLYNIWSYWARVVANLRSGGNTLGFSYDIIVACPVGAYTEICSEVL